MVTTSERWWKSGAPQHRICRARVVQINSTELLPQRRGTIHGRGRQYADEAASQLLQCKQVEKYAGWVGCMAATQLIHMHHLLCCWFWCHHGVCLIWVNNERMSEEWKICTYPDCPDHASSSSHQSFNQRVRTGNMLAFMRNDHQPERNIQNMWSLKSMKT